jgi:hypothetical protein
MRNNRSRSQNLSEAQGQLLVRLARHTLMERLGKQIPQAEIDTLNTALKDSCFSSLCGTFVTLKINERLRGCIGNLTSDTPMASGVRRNAINAAFHDPRFASLSTSELDRVSSPGRKIFWPTFAQKPDWRQIRGRTPNLKSQPIKSSILKNTPARPNALQFQ